MGSVVSDAGAVEALKLERDFLLRLLELTQHEDPGALLDEALRLAVDVSGARHAFIEITDPERRGDAARYYASTDELDLTRLRGLLSTTIMQAALAEGRTMQTNSAYSDPRFAQAESVRGRRIDAVLCVPIHPWAAPARSNGVARSPLGVLYLQGARPGGPFAPHAISLCEVFARHLATIAPALLDRARTHLPDATLRWREVIQGHEQLVGSSQAMASMLKTVASVASRDIGVLVTGPSGTGKTALVKIIAQNGPRARHPFVSVNCANLESSVLENELFGAYPGPGVSHKVTGKVEAAHMGTLFLDEVAELAPSVQAKLLQFLQDGSYFPLGAARPLRADVRVIAATNADLKDRVRQGAFREDLYYRLCVIEIAVPPLEERRVDIRTLADVFLRDAVSRLNLPDVQLSRRALRALEAADWPGNVRQLKNTIDAAAIRTLADDVRLIEVSHIFPDAKESDSRSDFQEIMRAYQRQVIIDALARNQGSVPETARALGLGRSSLYQLIKTLGIERL